MNTAITAIRGRSGIGQLIADATTKIRLLDISKDVFISHVCPWLAIIVVCFHNFHTEPNIVLIQVHSIVCPSC